MVKEAEFRAADIMTPTSPAKGNSVLVKIEIYHDGKSWCGRGIGVSLFTQGKTYEKLLTNIKEAAHLHFEEIIEAGETINLLLSKV